MNWLDTDKQTDQDGIPSEQAALKFNDENGFDASTHCLLSDGTRHFGDVYSITCSSMQLAAYICNTQRPMVGSPFEFVYFLNGRGLMPLERYEQMKSRLDTDKQADRDRISSEQATMAREQSNRLDRLREDFAQRERAAVRERREDKQTMALIYFAGKEDSKTVARANQAQLKVMNCKSTLTSLRSSLEAAEEVLDEFCDDSSAAARRKTQCALDRTQVYKSRITREEEEWVEVISLVKYIQNHDSPLDRLLVQRLGHEIEGVATKFAIRSSASEPAVDIAPPNKRSYQLHG